MNKKVQELKLVFGIIGCGMVANMHIENLLQLQNVEVKWVCDSNAEHLKQFMHSYGIRHGTINYMDILNDNTVDAIIICTPPNTHLQIALDAIANKKHTLIEKPIAINQEDARLLLKKALASPNLIVMDCAARHSRLQPKFNFVKDLISSGKLGNIYSIHHRSIARMKRPGIEYNPNAKWFGNKKISGGGPIIDWGVYDLAFHLGILNYIPELSSSMTIKINGLDECTRDNTEFDVEEHAIVTMQFKNNLHYHWERSTNAHNDIGDDTRIYGTKAGLKLSYLTWGSSQIEIYSVTAGKPITEIIEIDMSSHKNDFFAIDEHFVNCIFKNEQPILSLEESVKHLNMLLDISSSTTIQ